MTLPSTWNVTFSQQKTNNMISPFPFAPVYHDAFQYQKCSNAFCTMARSSRYYSERSHAHYFNITTTNTKILSRILWGTIKSNVTLGQWTGNQKNHPRVWIWAQRIRSHLHGGNTTHHSCGSKYSTLLLDNDDINCGCLFTLVIST